MRNFFRKTLAVFSITIVSLSLCSLAFASSYSTSFSFSVSVKGSTRSYTGSNIQFYTTSATSSPSRHRLNTTYYAYLYRDKVIDDYIGRVTLNRDSSGTARWSSVGAGSYYITLIKANDGVTLSSSSVTISNY